MRLLPISRVPDHCLAVKSFARLLLGPASAQAYEHLLRILTLGTRMLLSCLQNEGNYTMGKVCPCLCQGDVFFFAGRLE